MDNSYGILSELKYLLYAMFAYLHMEADPFLILILFMSIDTVSGILKTLKMDYKKFSFKLLLWGFTSKIGILIIPLLVALMFKGIGSGNGENIGFGVVIVMKFLIVSEFISAISNIYTVKTGIEVKDVDVFTMLFKFVRREAYNIISRYTKIDFGNEQKKEDEKNKNGIT